MTMTPEHKVAQVNPEGGFTLTPWQDLPDKTLLLGFAGTEFVPNVTSIYEQATNVIPAEDSVIKYDATDVYCIGVDSHAFVIRQQGSVWVSGNSWVRERFIDPRSRKPNCVFVPALLKDNPSVDYDSYVKNLQYLTAIDRERLLGGDWDVSEEGKVFQRHWFNAIKEVPKAGIKWVRSWDMASTKDGGDWTVGAKVGLTDGGTWIIADIIRKQLTPHGIEQLISQTAAIDGVGVEIAIEQEPGSSGAHVIDHYRRKVLNGYSLSAVRPSGDKVIRANPVASAAEAGNVSMLLGQWNGIFLDEVSSFPEGTWDDQIDSISQGFHKLAFTKRGRLLA